ncbi:MAG: hypothetical protein NTW12_07905 [Deltaproteobacteria bacterium]|nr:hypothetical protein [Deltaproteobacteria bacterium]
MILSASEIAIIGVGSTIVGTLLGAWIGYRLSLSLAQVTARRGAAMKLREAFKDEILAVNPAQHALEIELPVFLENAFDKHRAAVFDFDSFLKPTERTDFYAAWYRYYCHSDDCNENGIPYFGQYSCRGLTIEKEHEMKKRVRDRIEKILDFAKYQ